MNPTRELLHQQEQDANIRVAEVNYLLDELDRRPWPQGDQQVLLSLARRILLNTRGHGEAFAKACERLRQMEARELALIAAELRAEAQRHLRSAP